MTRSTTLLLRCIACLWLAAPAHAQFLTDSSTVLITGANRGLGLEFARQYADLNWNVIATCRDPQGAAELQALAASHPQVQLAELDVTSDIQVAAIAAAYKDQPIDVLLNNAGIYGNLNSQTLGNFDFEELKRVLDVNAIGSLRVTEALLPNVLASEQKKIISLGGGMGTQSIGRMFGGHYFMKMSKAAHLIAMGTLENDLRDTGVVTIMISPGRVDTQLMRDSGWTGKSTSADLSARVVIGLIEKLEPDMNGRLVMSNGKIVPW